MLLGILQIPDGTTIAIAATTTPAVTASSSRYCGRHLNPAVDQLAEVSVCSKYFLNTSTHVLQFAF